MKAVIVDLLDGQAAALCSDGCVVKLSDAGYSLGQEIEVHEQKRVRRKWLRTFTSAAAAAVFVLGIGGTAWALPYGVVSLDVNPSIEYTINCFDYVLSVNGVNEEGRALLAGMDTHRLVHRRIDEALSASVEQLEAEQWLAEGDDVLLAAGARRGAHAERLLSELENDLSGSGRNLDLHTVSVSREDIDAAHASGMSAGRQHVLRALDENTGGEHSREGWAERPVSDLLQALDQSEGGGKTESAGEDEAHRVQTDSADAPEPDGSRDRHGDGTETDINAEDHGHADSSALSRQAEEGAESGRAPNEAGEARPQAEDSSDAGSVPNENGGTQPQSTDGGAVPQEDGGGAEPGAGAPDSAAGAGRTEPARQKRGLLPSAGTQ